MAVSVYSCINCGGAVRFDIALSTFKCDRCAATFTLEEMNSAFPDDEQGSLWKKASEAADEKDAEISDISNAEDKEISVVAYHCNYCGAELMADSDTLAAAFCAYCKTPVTISTRLLSGKDMPSRVIPFKITKDEAFKLFHEKTKGKPLLPKTFRPSVIYNEMKSVYVPFRLYDAECSASITAMCSNVSTWDLGNTRYTKTDIYKAYRSGAMEFGKVPKDVSDKINDAAMEEIEPYDISAMAPFSQKYLSGHYAEAPTTKEEKSLGVLRGRLEPAAKSALLRTVRGYDSVSLSSGSVSLSKVESEYVMFPVWMFAARFKGEEYIFTINGQTGKMSMSDKLPLDESIAGFLFMKYAAIIFITAFLGMEVLLWLS